MDGDKKKEEVKKKPHMEGKIHLKWIENHPIGRRKPSQWREKKAPKAAAPARFFSSVPIWAQLVISSFLWYYRGRK